MADNSAIEWTDATWNPVTGCTKVSRGCDHCYAERFAERWRGIPGHPYEQGFDLRLWESRLDQPGRWHKPRMIFVNSMGDLFHKDVPGAFIDRVFAQMEAVDRHTYQVLTKRSLRMRDYLQDRYGDHPAPPHIWCGVSVEDRTVRPRIRHLAMAPAVVRFLSLEPLLESLGTIDLEGDFLGHRWWGKWSPGPAVAVGMGVRDSGSVQECRGALLLQAVGRTHT